MSHYMFRWALKDSTIRTLTETPQNREAAARQVIESFGGRMLSYHFILGDYDGMAICEFPDSISAAAASMRVAGTGGFTRFETHALLTCAEAQSAMQKVKDAGSGNYRPIGG